MRPVLATLAACAFAGQAHAITVSGTALGSFGDFDAGLSTATASITNNDATTAAVFAFGDGASSTISFDGYGSPGPNGLTGFTGSFDAPFAIGAVGAFKGPTSTYPTNGSSVVLTTVLSFTAPVAVTRTLTFTLDIGLFQGLALNTMDADVFGTGDIFPATFDYGGQRYDVALVGFDPDGFTNDFSLTQGVPFAAQLFAQITPDPTPVPEPASFALLGVGLLAAARFRRA